MSSLALLSLALLAACEGQEGRFPRILSGELGGGEITTTLFIEPGRPELGVGEGLLLRVRIKGPLAGTATAVAWLSRDTAVATVASPLDGCGDRCALVAGVAPGTTAVVASSIIGGVPTTPVVVVMVAP